MPSKIQLMTENKLISPPKWLPNNMMYETIMGSMAYGATRDSSDVDVYGFCIPPKELVFFHLSGEIEGFGRQKKRFEQFQRHHVKNEEDKTEYDFSIYNIVKYFDLLLSNNPNITDSIFTPDNCVLHCTHVGRLIRDNRRMFLSKLAFHRFLGYSYSQLHKMSTKTPQEGSKRDADVQAHGFDTKFAMHLVRLADELEQILTTGDIDLQRIKEKLKAIRRGEVSEQEIRDWFSGQEKRLQSLYETSTVVPHSPDEEKIKQLLIDCLEHHYGSLAKFDYINPNASVQALKDIQTIIEKNKTLLS